MPEASQIEYNLREVAEIMVREAGITEGHWMVVVRFKWAAATIGTSPDELSPSAIVGIDKIGIQRADSPNSLSVDAARLGRKAAAATAGATGKKRGK